LKYIFFLGQKERKEILNNLKIIHEKFEEFEKMNNASHGIACFESGKISGTVTFVPLSSSRGVVVTFDLKGFPKANTQYAAHIHEYGDLRQGCESLGGHFNPYHSFHGGPRHHSPHHSRHVGDLINNITTNRYKHVHFSFVDHSLHLSGKFSILGRSLVIHEGVDDLGLGGFPDSLITGHAGKRMACAVIGIMNPGT